MSNKPEYKISEQSHIEKEWIEKIRKGDPDGFDSLFKYLFYRKSDTIIYLNPPAAD